MRFGLKWPLLPLPHSRISSYCYWKGKVMLCTLNKDKKEEIWPSPMTKAPTPTEMSKGQVTTQTTSQKSSIKQRYYYNNIIVKSCKIKFLTNISRNMWYFAESCLCPNNKWFQPFWWIIEVFLKRHGDVLCIHIIFQSYRIKNS